MSDDEALERRLRDHYASLPGEEALVATLLAGESANGDGRSTVPSRGSRLARTRHALAELSGSPPRSRTRGPLRWAIAASVLLLSSVAVHVTGTLGERTERTVREAAMNHNTRLAPEFPADDLVALNESMALLPFEIRRPDRLGAEWRLIGGRYCSIAGHLAAHVRLTSPAGGDTLSLFVTREAKGLEHLDGEHLGIDGVDVELWDERGLFYAMARSAS